MLSNNCEKDDSYALLSSDVSHKGTKFTLSLCFMCYISYTPTDIKYRWVFSLNRFSIVVHN